MFHGHVAAIAVATLTIGPTATAMAAATAPNPAVSKALGAILEGDGPQALKLLNGLPRAGLSERDERFRLCAPERLRSVQPISSTEIPDPFARRLLAAYQSYWRAAVMAPERREAHERALLDALSGLLGQKDLPSFEAAEPLMAARLKSAGYYSLAGRTGPLRELMIWSTQTERTYRVELPEGVQPTRVFLLDGFKSLGWGSHLSCGRSGTGGWATKEGLFAVVPSYESLEDENFQINFLAHEAQHFADYERFPSLEPWELEYRAKLVEIAKAVNTREKIITRFRAQQSDDKASPHGYANKRVIEVMRKRLGLSSEASLSEVATAQLREAASNELLADTARRNTGSAHGSVD